MVLSLRAAACAAVCALPLAGTALAHVVSDPNEGAAGRYFRTAFRVTHGCHGSPTVAVTIRIPDGVLSVKPQPKAGWEVELRTRPLETPVRGAHGHEIRETVSEVTWRGGPLPDTHFDEFALSMRLPDQPGATLHFPVVQTCADGSIAWNGIPAPGQTWSELPAPAPFIRLRAPQP